MPISIGVPELLIFGVPAAGVVIVLARVLWPRQAHGNHEVSGRGDLPEPTVAACYAHAWGRLWPSFWGVFLAGLASLVVGLIGVVLGLAAGTLAMLAVQVLLLVPLGYGGSYVALRAARAEQVRAGHAFAPYGRALGPTLLTGGFVTLVTEGVPRLLDLLPGVIGIPLQLAVWTVATVRLSFVPYLVVDEERGAADAVLESWRRTRGRFWTLAGVGLLAVPVALAGLLLLVVGLIPAGMLIGLAHASLFAAVTALTPAADAGGVSDSPFAHTGNLDARLSARLGRLREVR